MIWQNAAQTQYLFYKNEWMNEWLISILFRAEEKLETVLISNENTICWKL